MKNPYLTFKIIDDSDVIPHTAIKYFKLSNHIKQFYPTAELILEDPEGQALANLAIRPGNILEVTAEDRSLYGEELTSEKKIYKLTPLVVVGVVNAEKSDVEKFMDGDDESRTSTLGGLIKVFLVHPWAVYSDFSNHGYTKKKISDIISSLAKNASGRGFSFNSVSISDTDDGNEGPNRYKLQESEVDFIKKSLLPYASRDKQGMYCFTDEQNNLFLKTYKELASKAPEFSLIPPLMETLHQQGSIFKGIKSPHEILEGYWAVGRNFADQIQNINKLLYVEDSEAQVSFKAPMTYKAPIDGSVLIKKGFLSTMERTSVDMIPHRYFEDVVKWSSNKTKVLDEFFEISILTTMCFEVGTIGKTTDLRLLSPEDGVGHWTNGTWLIAGSDTIVKNGGGAFSKLLLARPTIGGDGMPIPDSLNLKDYYKK